MGTLVITFAFIWVVVGPIITFIHEMGHALAALLLTRQPVRIQIGGSYDAEDIFLRWRLARLEIVWANFLSGFVGFYTIEHEARVPRLILVLVALAGPLTTFLLLIVLLLGGGLAVGFTQTVFAWAVTGAFLQLVLVLLPIKYPGLFGPYRGHLSDTARAFKHVRGA